MTDEYRARRELQDCDIRVRQDDSVEFNSGSETQKHYLAKCAAAWVLKERGYRLNSEVVVPDGEIDIIGYNGPDNDCIAVECETSPTDEVISDKVGRYLIGPIRDIFVINVGEVPTDFLEAVEYIRGEI